MTPAALLTHVGTAELVGTIRQPKLLLRFGLGMRHAQTGQNLVEWCKALPGRRWNPDVSAWEVNSLGPNPDRVLAAAGFELVLPETGELAGIVQLEQLYMPVTMLASNKRTVLIRTRFCGFEGTQALIDNAGTWDKERELLKMSVLDVVKGASPRPGILWDQASIDRSYEMHKISPLLAPELGPHAAALANALEPKKVATHIKAIQAHLGGPVGKFGVDLFPYQVIGAYGVAAGHRLLADSPGVGKAHPLTEPILTPTGFRPMGDIRAGDKVIGANGKPTEVLDVYPQGELDIFRVEFSDGSFSRVSGEHLWQVTDRKYRRHSTLHTRVLTTEEIIAEGLRHDGTSRRFAIPMTAPVQFEQVDLPVDPYLVGAVLGDGSTSLRWQPHITTDDEIVASLRLPEGGYAVKRVDVLAGVSTYGLNGCAAAFRSLGIMESKAEDKKIPPAYKLGSAEDRLALLQGLLDTDGSPITKPDGSPRSSIEYGTVSRQLARDVMELVQSLGGTASISTKVPKYVHNGEVREGQLYYRMVLSLPEWVVPFRLRRKLERWTPRTKYMPARRIVSIEPDGREESQCIRVAADDHLYVTRDFIVTHNTFQSLAATAALRCDAMLIICPPVVTTNWAREVVKSGIFAEDEIATYRTGRKEPSLDKAKVVIVSDSTLAARPHLIHHISIWMNRFEKVVAAYDEAHRSKTMGSKRSEAVLDMMALAPHVWRVAITGTPVLAGPHELVPILEFTGHLGPVFGGAGPFLEEYCTRDRFGAFHPKKRSLDKLHRTLNEHVWMRRTKKDVLPFLPEKHITSIELDVDLKEYKRTHAEVVDEIAKWFEAFKTQEGRFPNEGEIEEFSNDNLRYASALRKAAGMTKVPYAIEMVSEWVKGNPDEPVLVWAHHKDVIAALHETAKKAKVNTGVIAGGISDRERMRLVDEFQAGKIPVLICSITAAGVGITLTRSSNAIFVESDWTPALMLQAMDRQHRIGQTRDVHAEILLALGTLDEHMQGTLAKKGETLEVILGDDSNSVAVGQDMDRDLMNLKEVMAELIKEACRKLGLLAPAA